MRNLHRKDEENTGVCTYHTRTKDFYDFLSDQGVIARDRGAAVLRIPFRVCCAVTPVHLRTTAPLRVNSWKFRGSRALH